MLERQGLKGNHSSHNLTSFRHCQEGFRLYAADRQLEAKENSTIRFAALKDGFQGIMSAVRGGNSVVQVRKDKD